MLIKKIANVGAIVAKVIDNFLSTSSTDALSAGKGKELNDRLNNLLDMFYPVGTIYETTSADFDTTTKMANHFGGTWEVYGAGRVLVAKSSDPEFDTIGKTVGSKYMQNHYHKQIAPYGGFTKENDEIYNVTSTWTTAYADRPWVDELNTPNVTTGESGNIQPSIVAYRYRRIA